jgi:hypothetical protein
LPEDLPEMKLGVAGGIEPWGDYWGVAYTSLFSKTGGVFEVALNPEKRFL